MFAFFVPMAMMTYEEDLQADEKMAALRGGVIIAEIRLYGNIAVARRRFIFRYLFLHRHFSSVPYVNKQQKLNVSVTNSLVGLSIVREWWTKSQACTRRALLEAEAMDSSMTLLHCKLY
jgi:hypothetical protein